MNARGALPPKAYHVVTAKQTRGHHCHWPGCNQQVPPAMWGCRTHWFKLPKDLRDRIWRAYRAGQEDTKTPSREYVAVAREAQDWIARHLAQQPKQPSLELARGQ